MSEGRWRGLEEGDREDGKMVERKERQGGEEMVGKEEEKMRKGKCEGMEEEGDRTVGEHI